MNSVYGFDWLKIREKVDKVTNKSNPCLMWTPTSVLRTPHYYRLSLLHAVQTVKVLGSVEHRLTIVTKREKNCDSDNPFLSSV